jgi:hypothetical protein
MTLVMMETLILILMVQLSLLTLQDSKVSLDEMELEGWELEQAEQQQLLMKWKL